MLTESTVYNFHTDGTLPDSRAVFVFASNMIGYHGAGNARVALTRFGAIRCVGAGRMNQCYAIPTGNTPWVLLELSYIRRHVEAFKNHARSRPSEQFWITRVGCETNGYVYEPPAYRDEQVAPLFIGSPPNCHFAEQWRAYLVGSELAPALARSKQTMVDHL